MGHQQTGGDSLVFCPIPNLPVILLSELPVLRQNCQDCQGKGRQGRMSYNFLRGWS